MDQHPLVVFGGSSSRTLASEIADNLHIELGKAEDKPFPNGERMVKIKTDVRNRDVFVVQSICRPHVNDYLMDLLVWGDALKRASAFRRTAVIPCFGYARQDRKTESRTPITARLVCDLIEQAGYDRVLTMDLHAEQIQGFFSIPLDHLMPGQIFSEAVASLGLSDAVVVCPDVGNMKKLDRHRQGFPEHFGVAVIDKRRDCRSGKVEMVGILGDVRGKNIIMCDDIISTAGTMEKAIEFVLNKGGASGAKQGIYIIATHGEFAGTAVEKLSRFDKLKMVAVTNTIDPSSTMSDEAATRLSVKILTVAPLFAQAIGRIHRGESISELLGKFG